MITIVYRFAGRDVGVVQSVDVPSVGDSVQIEDKSFWVSRRDWLVTTPALKPTMDQIQQVTVVLSGPIVVHG